MQPLRIGLIGAGKHGSRYAKHIAEDIPQAELAGICRRNTAEGEQLAAKYDCPYYADYRQLIEDGSIDAIAIAVPPYLHRQIVELACQAGKHILIEKPLAVSVAEAKRIQSLIANSAVRCMVAHTLRFNSVVQTLKAHIADIAPLQSVYLSQRFEPSPLQWLDHKAESGGGIILHTGVHSFDLLRFLSDSEVERVWCQTMTICTKETEDNFQMQCQFETPLLTGASAGSRSTQSRSGLIELSGANGQLIGDHAHGFAHLVQGMQRTALTVGPPVHTVCKSIEAFVEGVQHNTLFPISVEDGLQSVAIAEACYRSVESGGTAEVKK